MGKLKSLGVVHRHDEHLIVICRVGIHIYRGALDPVHPQKINKKRLDSLIRAILLIFNKRVLQLIDILLLLKILLSTVRLIGQIIHVSHAVYHSVHHVGQTHPFSLRPKFCHQLIKFLHPFSGLARYTGILASSAGFKQ